MFYRENGQFKASYVEDLRIFKVTQDRVAVLALVAIASVLVPLLASDYLLRAVLIPFLILALAAIGLDFPAGKSRFGDEAAAESVLVDLEDQLGHLPRGEAAEHLFVPGREGLFSDPALHLERAVAQLRKVLVSKHGCSQR